MSDLKTYLELKAEQERLNKMASDAGRQIAIKRSEIQKLEDERSDLVYQAREITEVMRKMEVEAGQLAIVLLTEK